jgi:hypothetical protein
MNSASLCSLAGRYENPIPHRCLAPIDFLKIPAQKVNGGTSLLYTRQSLVISHASKKVSLGHRWIVTRYFNTLVHTVFTKSVAQGDGTRGTPQAVAICAWPWLFVLAAAVCSFLLKISKKLGLNIILTILIHNI